jgi:RHH-type proline utilization regulon transcriptional repressor/proline dehydrogenase/delta 1-pyrroline-5-carboxylate dehydrogenase
MSQGQSVFEQSLDAAKYEDETTAAQALLAAQPLDPPLRAAIQAEARELVRAARALKRRKGVMEGFLEEFGLSNNEGLALMCLAEALLRVPDDATADKLIAEKIKTGNWEEHLGRSDSWLVNAGAWGLMLTGRVVSISDDLREDAKGFLGRMVSRAGEPVIRAAMMQAMRILGEQFVLGRTIEAALRRGRGLVKAGEAATFSFDMLGEGARTDEDARRYLKAYADAIDVVGAEPGEGPYARSGVSVKLSALHPRFDARREREVMDELYPRIVTLAERAKAGGVGFCIDAEEADRLVLTLKILERLSREPSLVQWSGLGLAVQAYHKRGRAVVATVRDIARGAGRRLMVRLVKGAYWDGEIKRAQIAGRTDYPVWTTKAATDVSYLACAKLMLEAPDAIYPQFATHNAHTAVAIRRLAEAAGVKDYEYQRLHGMGEALYQAARFAAPVRVYAPVGGHEDLLPYLVRRLLENGANTSFVHSFLDDDVSPDIVAADPVAALEAGAKRHPRLPAPPALYGSSRRNSSGRDLSVAADRAAIAKAIEAARGAKLFATPIIGEDAGPATRALAVVTSPADPAQVIGRVAEADAADVEKACAIAAAAQPGWAAEGGVKRARVLRAMADALEADLEHFVALIALEAGRTLQDGIDEVREAVDFCRYYAAEAERLFAVPQRLPGPTGETNLLELSGRGVFACISPWNFPLAIFTGQIAAALAAGNAVVAKPAEQTPLIAAEAVRRFREAGLPADVLALLPGRGETVGVALVADPRIAGVAFTGGTETAQAINRALAGRRGPIPVLIAETGGLNAMFVDTSALKEQVVDDVLLSAYGSAGQRCSALRLLYLPHETAEEIVRTLKGAIEAASVGDPAEPETEIGPVIDAASLAALRLHADTFPARGRWARQLSARHAGHFMAPTILELDSLDGLDREVFGPILHVLRYDPEDIEAEGAKLAAKGFGLTLGVHSRLERFAEAVMTAVPAGNVYVNRSMIGAVVGVQPFGGHGLSGTGPKAGGPHYLPRFAQERTVTVNIAAQGGDPALLNL